jgi:hypothetical protein
MDDETAARAIPDYIKEMFTGEKAEAFAADLQAFCNSGQVPQQVEDKGAYYRGLVDCRDEAIKLAKKHFGLWV